jgi:hypothetical protein
MPSFGGLRERECPRCHREVDLPLGQICGQCQREANRKAARIARWVSLGTTIMFGAYVLVRVPQDQTVRIVSGGAIVMWFVVSRIMTLRIAREWFLRY